MRFPDHSDIDPRFPPRRLVYAQVLVRNPVGDVLLASSNLRDDNAWNLLTMRALKDEPPHDVARRAGFHDVSLKFDTLTLLVVDAVTAGDDRTEALWFLFDGGIPAKEDLDNLPKPGETHDNLRFEPSTNVALCCAENRSRVQHAVDRLTDPFAPVYLTNGHPPA
ncbi:hypothetical protein [Kitasatospora sp. NPDC050463]|uniref:hypothetical protein n=1 Tax=Kitasatospora sp. NPDC050463 TaxID=3155786 RepID=UPI00340AD1A4